MKKAGLQIIFLLGILLVTPFISAEIMINSQPKEIYNLEDVILIPITIKTVSPISGIFNVDLLCGTAQINFFKNGVSLSAGEEKRMEASLVLTKSVIGGTTGTCKIKAYLGEKYTLTNNFKISNLMTIEAPFESSEFVPEDSILIGGQVTKETGKEANGFIELTIVEGESTILSQLETVTKGFFSINASLPENMKAGTYLAKLNAYELDFNSETTNKGFLSQNIKINQVPKSLEIFFENKEVGPGTNLKVKAILYDQTGEKIYSTATIIIKDKNDKIFEQVEINTDEFFEFPIANNEKPSEWKVLASSNELTSESNFIIIKKESISIEITNKTLIITNTGNVPYNKTALVKIGNSTLNIDVYLDVNKFQKYLLTAPDGNYNVEVISGDYAALEEVALTGKSIDIKEISSRATQAINQPFIWIFVILILGFVAFFMFKRGYKRTFIGRIVSKVKKNDKEEHAASLVPLAKGSLFKSRNKAELSISIKGDRQNVCVAALNLKNFKDLGSKEGNAQETIQKAVDLAESHKAATYESHNTLFFIISPIKTRTFKNEGTALEIAQKIREILNNHNKIFKQRINFGISLNYGEIVAAQERDSLKFMSLGNLLASTKKIASVAEDDILLGEKMNDMLRSRTKTIKHEKNGINVYSIKEIKDPEEHKKFIRSFLNRIEDKK